MAGYMKWNVFGKEVDTNFQEFAPDSVERAYYLENSSEVVVDIALDKFESLQSELHELGHVLLERVSVTQTETSADVQEVIVNSQATWIIENRKKLIEKLQALDKE